MRQQRMSVAHATVRVARPMQLRVVKMKRPRRASARREPFCCQVAWTETCSFIAQAQCLSCCGNGTCEPAENACNCSQDCEGSCCGDGECTGEENCGLCPQDCGNCTGGCCSPNATPGCTRKTWFSACAVHFRNAVQEPGPRNVRTKRMTAGAATGIVVGENPSPGCADDGVESCVCQQDPYCCEVSWADFCSVKASECLGCCGDNFCGPGETCGNCAADCGCDPALAVCEDGSCVGFCGNGICDGNETCYTCPSECGACEGGCCLAHDSPGCVDQETMDCVAELSPGCVLDTWSPICVSAAAECGKCGGECCEGNGSPGCGDPDIEACVCEVDPECCDVGWDQECADLASDQCQGCCGDGTCGPGEDTCSCAADCPGICCGNGVCDADETCGSCSQDCGACEGPCCIANDSIGCQDPVVTACVCDTIPTCCENPWTEACAAAAKDCGSCQGSCCEVKDSPGCNDVVLQACVCDKDAYCCSTSWDQVCVNYASDDCVGCCGDGICGAGEDGCNCQADCPQPCCGDGTCDPNGEGCTTCPQDCGLCEGNCCISNGTPGCEYPDVTTCVCDTMPECCSGPWTTVCAEQAEQCGTCAGDCCAPNGSPGCSDSNLESCVCNSDLFCCEVTWDLDCATLAATECSGCWVTECARITRIPARVLRIVPGIVVEMESAMLPKPAHRAQKTAEHAQEVVVPRMIRPGVQIPLSRPAYATRTCIAATSRGVSNVRRTRMRAEAAQGIVAVPIWARGVTTKLWSFACAKSMTSAAASSGTMCAWELPTKTVGSAETSSWCLQRIPRGVRKLRNGKVGRLLQLKFLSTQTNLQT